MRGRFGKADGGEPEQGIIVKEGEGERALQRFQRLQTHLGGRYPRGKRFAMALSLELRGENGHPGFRFRPSLHQWKTHGQGFR